MADGIWRTHDDSTWEQVALPDDIQSPSSAIVSTDLENTLWITVTQQKPKRSRIYSFHAGAWRLFPTPAQTARFRNIGALHFSRSGDVWAPTINEGVWHFSVSSWTHYAGGRGDNAQKLCGSGITGICIDAQQRVWVATHNGISCFSNGRWQHVVIAPLGITETMQIYVWNPEMASLYLDHHGILWIGTLGSPHIGWIDTTKQFNEGIDTDRVYTLSDFLCRY